MRIEKFHLPLVLLEIPPLKKGGKVMGISSGVDPEKYRILFYYFCPGRGWFSKVNLFKSGIPIEKDGRWQVEIQDSGPESCATRFSIFLAHLSRNFPVFYGARNMPSGLSALALTSLTVNR